LTKIILLLNIEINITSILLCPQGQIFRYSVKMLLSHRHNYDRMYSNLRFNLRLDCSYEIELF